MPILEITQAADVGMGSFYNHFETKEQLFEAAVEAVMDGYGQLLDDLTADIEDPAEVFACSFRLTGRLHRREPELSRVLLNNVLRLLSADNGLAPRARRDITAAVDAGRFDVEDLDVAVTMAAGALIALGQLLHDQPERDVEETTDRVTEELLRMFGVRPAAARRICRLPLPDLEAPFASDVMTSVVTAGRRLLVDLSNAFASRTGPNAIVDDIVITRGFPHCPRRHTRDPGPRTARDHQEFLR